MANTQQEQSLLNINLSNARSENESYEDYRIRLKTNRQILKTYFTHGREGFREMFPQGIDHAMQQAAQAQTEQTATESSTDGEVEYRLASE